MSEAFSRLSAQMSKTLFELDGVSVYNWDDHRGGLCDRLIGKFQLRFDAHIGQERRRAALMELIRFLRQQGELPREAVSCGCVPDPREYELRSLHLTLTDSTQIREDDFLFALGPRDDGRRKLA